MLCRCVSCCEQCNGGLTVDMKQCLYVGGAIATFLLIVLFYLNISLFVWSCNPVNNWNGGSLVKHVLLPRLTVTVPDNW